MDKALHPTKPGLILVGDYIKNFGFGDIDGIGMTPLAAKCPCCLHDMSVAPAVGQRSAHFRHARNNTGCQTIALNGEPYARLPAPQTAPAEYQRAKEFLRDNWRCIYARFREIVPATKLSEFAVALEVAHRRQLLAYTNLDMRLLPYFLCALGDFTIRTGIARGPFKRQYNFRFYFQQHPRAPNVLWIEEREHTPFYRMTYKYGKILKVDDPIDLTSVELSRNVDNVYKTWETQEAATLDALLTKRATI